VPCSAVFVVLGSRKEQASDAKKHRDPDCAEDDPVAQWHARMLRGSWAPSSMREVFMCLR
jgi:hypothetical protein